MYRQMKCILRSPRIKSGQKTLDLSRYYLKTATLSYSCKCRISRIYDPCGSKYLFSCNPQNKYLGARHYCDALPTHQKIPLPALSPTMEKGTIVSWEKKEGDKLNEGDLLAEIETDKATMGFETPEEGYLAKIVVPAGSRDVPIGQLLCIIVENEADVGAFNNYTPTQESGKVEKVSAPTPKPTTTHHLPKASEVSSKAESLNQQLKTMMPLSEVKQTIGDRIFASPLAKRLAAEKGLDLSTLPSSPSLEGMLRAKDISSASKPISEPKVVEQPTVLPSPSKFTDHTISNIRNVIANRLLESKSTVPHYYLTVEMEVDNILKFRQDINKMNEKEGIKLSVNDFIIKATALACLKVPAVNSAWMQSHIREFHNVDVSVAVNTDRGLITPIVFEANKKGLLSISNDVKKLAAKAKEGKLQPQEFQGGTISISNLGMYSVTNFSAIINPPQSCILAVGTTEKRIVPCESSDKKYRTATFMSVTLSCDHRVVDGAVGAQWLGAFKQFIEKPQTMLL